jgi:MFS family permease
VLNLWRDIGRDTRWVLISYMLWGIGEGLWMFIQPLYVKSLGATPDEAGLALGMWGLGRLLLILPAGILADRIGARRVMLPGWFLGLIGVLIIALAPGWEWTAPGFLVYGFSAIAIPNTNLYITQAARHDPTRRPDLPLETSLTALWAAYAAGIVVTPAIGGWIGDRIGLRAVFLFSLCWFALSAGAIFRTRAYPRADRPAQGYNYRGLLRQRRVVMAFGLITLGFIAVLIGQPLSSQFLEEARGFSRASIGAFGSISALGTAVFSLLLGRVAAWRGFFASLFLAWGAFALLLLSGSPVVVIVAVFLLGAYYTTRPLATSVISPLVSERQRGMAFALLDSLAGLATVVGTNTAGTLYVRSPNGPFWAAMIGVIGVAALGAIWLRPAVQPSRDSEVAAAYTEAEQPTT